MMGKEVTRAARPDDDARPTRRGALRRFFAAGVFATAGAGVLELLGQSTARASEVPVQRLPAELVLKALPADVPAELVAAIESGCCTYYYRDEWHCGGPCPTGSCCYHIVSYNCGIDIVACVEVNCSTGDFSTGC